MRRSRLLIIVLIPLIYLSFFYPRIDQPAEELSSGKLSVLPLVTHYTKRYYVDQSLINPKKMLVAGLDRLERTLDEVLVDFPNGENSSFFKVQVMEDKKKFDMTGVGDLDKVEEAVEEVFRYIQPRMVSKEVKIRDVEYAVIDEMLKTLDAHSAIITPDIYKEFMIETEGSFGGLGIVIGVRDGRLTVIAPIEGTPAYKAGVKPNDRIVQIEDESTVNMSLIEAVGKLRGPKGTVANVHIMREGFGAAKKFSISRDTIRIESIEGFNLNDGIGYIKIRDFQKNTLDSLEANLKKLEKRESIKGLILDLRGDPGGLLEQAERVSDVFLKNGIIVSTKVGESKKRSRADDDDFEFDGKVVVLMDAGSASASEIVAGAIKNNDRGVIIGDRSFGKGSVQQILDLKEGSALKLTIADYLTPGDISIQDIGITPDIRVHPVVVSEDLVSFNSASQNSREEKLNGRALEKPVYSIFYLDQSQPGSDEKEGDEEIPEEALSKEEKEEKLASDFFVNVGKEILLSSKSYSREEMLEQGKNEIVRIHDEEERKIGEQLQKLGVDWSAGDKTPGGGAATSVKITPAVLKVKAGENLRVDVEVENTGSIPLYRLMATTKSDNPTFDSRDFVLGKLDPGEKRNWGVSFEIPKESGTREDEITLKFRNEYDTELPDFEFRIEIEELPKPTFAFNYEISDDGKNGSQGNGNGIPETGETVSLLVRLKNTGAGASEKGVVSLRNLSGGAVFLKQGRYEFENLNPGDVKEAPLMFTVSKSDAEVDMELQIIDETYREGIFGKIQIPRKGEEIKPGSGLPSFSGSTDAFKDSPSINITEIPLSTKSEEAPLKLSVNDKDGVEVVSVFVGDDKVMLIPSGEKKLSVSAKVKLEEGVNLITVLAKDKEGFTSRESAVVRRDT